MPAIRPRHPRLLRLGESPAIVGHRCTTCDRIAFPPDPYGCEACGAVSNELAEVELTPAGVISAMAKVHRHHRPQPEVPFTVVTVVLDEGVALKGVLVDDEGVSVGDRVHGVVVPWETEDDGTEIVDLHFEKLAVAGGDVR